MSTQQRPAPKDDADRGASVIQTAIKLLEAGQARGWSDALAQAAKKVK